MRSVSFILTLCLLATGEIQKLKHVHGVFNKVLDSLRSAWKVFAVWACHLINYSERFSNLVSARFTPPPHHVGWFMGRCPALINFNRAPISDQMGLLAVSISMIELKTISASPWKAAQSYFWHIYTPTWQQFHCDKLWKSFSMEGLENENYKKNGVEMEEWKS